MKEAIGARKVSSDKFYNLTENFVLDLIALYSLTEEKVLALVDRAKAEGWTPQEFINEIDKII